MMNELRLIETREPTMSVSPIPEGYHSLTAYLICKGANEAIEFYKKAFNAEEVMKLDMPGGMIGHAELKIGDSHLMLADECEMASGPPVPGDSGTGICLYVENCDEIFAQAIAAGGTEKRPMVDQFYGDRSGTDRGRSSTRSAMSGRSARTSKI